MDSHKTHAALVAVAVVGAVLLGSVVSANYLSASLVAQFGGEELSDFEDQERFQQDKKNEQRQFKDRQNECKNMQRQLKQIVKKFPKDVGDLGTQVSGFCNALTQGKQILDAAQDRDMLQDYWDYKQENIDSVTGEIWDGLNQFQNRLNVFNELKNQKRTCKDWARQVKEVTREAKKNKIDLGAFGTEATAKVTECEQNYAKLKSAADTGDWDGAQEVLQDFFWNNDFWQWMDEHRQMVFACGDLSRVAKDNDRIIKQAAKAEKKLAAKGKDTSTLKSLLDEAASIVAEAKQMSGVGQCDPETAKDLRDRLQEVSFEFDEELRNLKGEGSDGYGGYGGGGYPPPPSGDYAPSSDGGFAPAPPPPEGF